MDLSATPIASFGLGGFSGASVAPVIPGSPSGAPATGGVAFFSTELGGFFRSPEFGLLIGLGLVLYIDGRVLPRRPRR